MKYRLILVALVCSLVTLIDSGIGQETESDKEHLSAAHELLEAAQLGKTFGETIEAMMDLQIKQNPMIKPYKKVMLKFFSKYMSWNSLKDEIAQIHAEAFTVQELKELTAFYRTPVGRKAALLMPQLAKKGGELGAKRVQAHMAELQQMIAEESRRLAEEEIPNNRMNTDQ